MCGMAYRHEKGGGAAMAANKNNGGIENGVNGVSASAAWKRKQAIIKRK
jgi:hypothetical protein